MKQTNDEISVLFTAFYIMSTFINTVVSFIGAIGGDSKYATIILLSAPLSWIMLLSLSVSLFYRMQFIN